MVASSGIFVWAQDWLTGIGGATGMISVGMAETRGCGTGLC